MSPEQELFIVLTRLRCGILEQDLAVRCELSTSHISRICITWIDLLHSHMQAIPIWASRANIQSNMPSCFRSSYPETQVILDCTEIFIEMASSFRTQSATFSNYKHSNTAKVSLELHPIGQLPLFQNCILVGQVIKMLQSTVVSYSYWNMGIQ